MRPALLLLPLFLAACASDFPEVEAQVSAEAERADYPALLPIEDLLAAAQAGGAADPAAELEARAAALRARAAGLQGPVIDPGERAALTP